MKKLKKVIVLMVVALSVFGGAGFSVHAEDLLTTKFEGPVENDNPASWDQTKQPFADENYPVFGKTYGETSCGAHALAAMFRKSKVWGNDKNAKDSWAFFRDNQWATKGGGGYNSMGSPTPDVENGKQIKMIAAMGGTSIGSIESFAKAHYEKGNYVLINVPNHIIAMDYVDDDGNIVVLDSGHRYKYLDGVHNYYHQKYGGPSSAWAYEIEGAKANSSDSINFWQGGTSSGGESENGEATAGDDIPGGDPFIWQKKPIVEFNDDDIQAAPKKGLNTSKKSWFDWLLGG